MATPEGHILNVILQWLKLNGIPVWRNNTGAVKRGKGYVSYGCVGSGDILGVLPGSGRMLSIECKTRRGRATQAQQAFMGTINEAGGLAFVARSLEDVALALTEAGVEIRVNTL